MSLSNEQLLEQLSIQHLIDSPTIDISALEIMTPAQHTPQAGVSSMADLDQALHDQDSEPSTVLLDTYSGTHETGVVVDDQTVI